MPLHTRWTNPRQPTKTQKIQLLQRIKELHARPLRLALLDQIPRSVDQVPPSSAPRLEKKSMKQITSSTLLQATVAKLDRQRAVITATTGRNCSRSEIIEAALNEFKPMDFSQWLLSKEDEDSPIGDLAQDYKTKLDGPLGNTLHQWLRYLKANNRPAEELVALSEAHAEYLQEAQHTDVLAFL